MGREDMADIVWDAYSETSPRFGEMEVKHGPGAYGYQYYYDLVKLAIKKIGLPAKDVCVLSLDFRKTDPRQNLFIVTVAARVGKLTETRDDTVPAFLISVDPDDAAWTYSLFYGEAVPHLAKLLARNFRTSPAPLDYQIPEFLAEQILNRNHNY